MEAIIEKTGKKNILKFTGTVKSLLLKLNINTETVLIVRDGELLTDDDKISDKDSVKILSVISGG